MKQKTIHAGDLLQTALKLHRGGDAGAAGRLYAQVLAAEPRNAVALHYSGVLAQQQGELDKAAELMQRSIAVNGRIADYHSNLAIVRMAQGKLDDAIACCRSAERIRPDHAPSQNNLGIALRKAGRLSEALSAFDRAVALAPRALDMLDNLAAALAEAGEPARAAKAYSEVISLGPSALRHQKFAAVLARLERISEAEKHYRLSAQLDPRCAETKLQWAALLWGQARLDEAMQLYQQATAELPENADLVYNLGVALTAFGRCDQAIACYEKALRLRPNWPEPKWNRALALLLKGDYAEGFLAYEDRWEYPKFPSKARNFDVPTWDGSDPRGKTILLHAEQGLGDTIQFVRYASRLARRGARVLVECQWELVALLANLPGVAAVAATQQITERIDLHCPLLSLPHRFGTTLESIPSAVPYVSAPADSVSKFSKIFGRPSPQMRIGIVWKSGKSDVLRNCPPADLAALSAVPGVAWYSLQKDADPADLAEIARHIPITELGSAINDFADTAGAIRHLDMVLSVDTSVAHLAGAMGKPTWTLLPFAADWRWLRNRDDSPWYPTIRLFRQTQMSKWQDVITRVAAALSEQMADRPRLAA